MKIIQTLSAVALLCVACPELQAKSAPTEQGAQVGTEQGTQVDIKKINAKALHKLITSKKQMILLDARGDKYFDGVLIETAQRLSSDAPDEKIAEMLPKKDEKIIVYCGGGECPASHDLAKRLVAAGYTQVYDYPGGIKDWTKRKLPTTMVK